MRFENCYRVLRMLIERVVVAWKKYKRLKGKAMCRKFGVCSLGSFPKRCGKLICKLSVLVGIKFRCNKKL